MIKLKNIKIDGNKIRARVIPIAEDAEEFDIKINVVTNKITDSTDGHSQFYVNMVAPTLYSLYENFRKGIELPKEYVVACY